MVTTDFATPISTDLDWHDLVLDAATRGEVDTILRWVRHSDTLLEDWKLGRRLKPGYLCLFHGAPGTGKTLTACLIGKQLGVTVYRVDLWRAAEDLPALLEKAAEGGWILFFDEADALFGKRGDVQSSHDRYANQQVSYLLQRLEEYPGVAIFASNLRSQRDEAFARRFQAVIHFHIPSPPERVILWRRAFGGLQIADDVDFAKIAEDHALSGGAIVNVLRYAALIAAERGSRICAQDLHDGIRREQEKAGAAT